MDSPVSTLLAGQMGRKLSRANSMAGLDNHRPGVSHSMLFGSLSLGQDQVRCSVPPAAFDWPQQPPHVYLEVLRERTCLLSTLVRKEASER